MLKKYFFFNFTPFSFDIPICQKEARFFLKNSVSRCAFFSSSYAPLLLKSSKNFIFFCKHKRFLLETCKRRIAADFLFRPQNVKQKLGLSIFYLVSPVVPPSCGKYLNEHSFFCSVSSHVSSFPQNLNLSKYSYAHSVFDSLVNEKNIRTSVLLAKELFPIYGDECDDLWKAYGDLLNRDEKVTKNITNYKRVVNLFSEKNVYKLSFWEKLTKNSMEMITNNKENIDDLLYILNAYSNINYKSQFLIDFICKQISAKSTELSIPQILLVVRCFGLLGCRMTNILLNFGEILCEDMENIKPVFVINFLYSFSLLSLKDQNTLQFAARYLHMYLSKGELSPWEKTKLCRAYALLKFEHITFFKHIAYEIIEEEKRFQQEKYYKPRKEEDNLEAQKGKVFGERSSASENETDFYNGESNLQEGNEQDTEDERNSESIKKFFNKKYEEGIGFYEDYSNGTKKVNIMPNVWEKQHHITGSASTCDAQSEEEDREENSSETNLVQEEEIKDEFCVNLDSLYIKNENAQTNFSAGQISLILDSMIYLGMHRTCGYVKDLSVILIAKLRDKGTISQLDSHQLVSCMILFSNFAKHENNEPIVKALTTRIIKLFVLDVCRANYITLFLKELVIYSGKKKTKKNVRQRTLRWKEYNSFEWINSVNLTDNKNKTFSLLQIFCQKLCSRVYLFTLSELALCLRSVSYLGFGEHSFYEVFINYIKDRIGDLQCGDIANITQAFNNQKVEDRHLFYMLGKRYQLLQQAKSEKQLLVNRIG